jgi:signal peptidase II
MGKRVKTIVLVGGTVVFADQFLKFLAPRAGLLIVENTGVAFGLFPNFAWALVIFFFLLLLGFNVTRKQSEWSFTLFEDTVYYSLILGGGLSNFADRLFFGHIRDFIDLKIWPVFNLADVAISVGVFLLFLKQVKARTNFIQGNWKD